LQALKKQTLKLDRIVLINDGSVDKTEEIARNFGAELINLPYHAVSYVSDARLDWKMAAALNKGFPVAKCDYFLHLGADTVLPETYLERLVSKMENDPLLVVASGQIEEEPSLRSHVRGSGRLHKTWFWNKHIHRFPLAAGWESYPLYKARSLGLNVESFPDIKIVTQRATRLYKAKYGVAMRSYGYFPPFALAKCLLSILLGKKHGIQLTISYVFPSVHNFLDDGQIKNWVRLHQIKRLFHLKESAEIWKKRL